MTLDRSWFTEAVDATGSAFSLKAEKVHEERTPFQSIEIWKTETFGYLMTIDGCTMVTTRDNFLYHEMMSHPALNSHPNPRNVVVVGGGDCGTLREVLKHPEVESATQVEIDERVTRLSEQYFPELCDKNNDPRATLFFGDGIQWMKDAPEGSIDLIIIDSTDPVGPAEGLFGKRFYLDCIRALRADGMLVQQSESPLLHQDLITEMHQAMRDAGFAQTHLLHFPQPIYPSGWWSGSIACKQAGALAERLDPAALDALDTQYYNAEIHRGAFALPNFMRRALKA
ncbi:polyamine aminopropyltransferase [Sinimarinibacterium sp. CAU 1509]|uniref:polyamine aminopropyltransferase n=1 Tax=Sinimarinibacterium sp. CAU 1509 TaxID=2562283 RepID=UPI0010AC1D8D|nr:polyamine aminopropyltransferase [Sinimarinibacterium sp. CAU 1509]TJY58383.1 polyamine aminopropyltransferase [Sinimarinibacterium sp. CAU 1509]